MTGRNPMVLCLALAAALAVVAQAKAQQTPPPEFHPADDASVPASVVISCVSPEAKVYYTTDGTEATNNSFRYTAPITLTTATTLRARAYLDGFSPSDERTATYYERDELVTVQKLVANDGTPKAGVSVNVTPAAAVRSYAVEETIPAPLEPSNIAEGGTWDEDSRTIRWGPFEDAQARSLTYQVSCWQDGVWEIDGRVSLNGRSTQSDDSTTQATVTIQHTYAKTATPVFSPSSGGAALPVTVTLSCTTTSAAIYFTTDGTVPDTNSTVYAAPLPLTDTTFLRARAFADGMDPSDVTNASYWESDVPILPIRTITPLSDAVASVDLSLPVDGVQCAALTEFLPNGLEPSQISDDGVWDADTGTIQWGPFEGLLPINLSYQVTGPDGTYTLDGVASFDGQSSVVTGDTQVVITRLVQQVATPQLTPSSGTPLPTTVMVTCTTESAAIHYTTNGALPTTSDPLYADPLPVAADTILRARAFKDDWLPSEPASAYYWAATETSELTRTVVNNTSALPEVQLEITPVSGTKSCAVEETVPQTLTPADISDDGAWDEAAGTIRWGPFEDDAPRTLTYSLQGPEGTYALDGQCSLDGRSFSITGELQVVVTNGLEQQVETPALSPAASATMPVTVTLSCGTDEAEIRYTTNSRIPDTSATLYTGPLELTVPTILRVRAFKAGMSASDTVTGNYQQGEPAQWIIVRTVEDNDSRTPICTLEVTPSDTVKSYAVEERLPALLLPSSISDGGSWDEDTATIRWGPFEDDTPRSLSYTVSAPDGDYVLDGSGSFDGWSTETTGDLTVSIAGHSEQVATPEFSPPGGGQVPLTVTISCATPEAAIYYTTSGLVPTTNDTRYTIPVSLTSETTLRARAFKADLLPSDTVLATYPAPFNPGTIVRAIRGSPSTVQDVSLTVTPAASTCAYAIEEYVPAALKLSVVNEGGTWSAEDRLIRWGPFLDHQARTLSYSVTGPDGDYSFDGAASFDGINRPATGDATTVIGFPAPANLAAVAGNGAVHLRWDRLSGATGYNVYFWTVGNLNSPQVLNAGNPSTDYFPVNGLANNTAYYFSVTAYNSAGHESGHSENIKAVPSASRGVLGVVWFDRTDYRPTDQAIVSVMDADLNTDITTPQAINVWITSDSDPWGFAMPLVETGANTNLFTSEAAGTNLAFTFEDSDPTNNLIQIAEGDQITVVYDDVQPAMARTNTAVVESSPPATLIVIPIKTASYGSLLVGKTAERTFNVFNVGSFNISGTVSIAEPFFSVVSGGSYTLMPGQSTTTTIRYAPTAAGNSVATVTFTGGSGATQKLTGSAFTDPTPSTGTIAGKVTRADDSTPVNGVIISVIGSDGKQYGHAVTATTAGKAGVFSVAGLRPNAHYRVTAFPPTPLLLGMVTTDEVTVLAGQTTPVNIALPSITPDDPPPALPTPVVLVRGFGANMEWADDDQKSWSDMRTALENTSEFVVWDPNEKEKGIVGGHGGVINGTYGIDQNANALKVYLKEKAEKYRTTFGHGHYPPQIHFVAHSMGGLITRRALHDYDENGFPCSTAPLKVGKVVMLATPNCGSPVADVVLRPQMYGLLAQLIAANSAEFWMQAVWYSTKDLTPDNMRNQFNGANPWPSVPLYLFSASNSQYGKGRKWVNGTDDLCYLGDFAISKYNKLHGVQGTDERIHDGAVTKPSANGVYWTSKPTIHAVSNVTFRALPTSDASLWLENPVQSITDSDLGRPLDHLFLLTDSAVISWVVETLLNPDPVPTAYTTNASARTQNAMSLNAGIAQQEIPERVFESLGGTVTNGTVAALPVAADASTTLTFELMASDTNIIFRLNDPSGTPIDGDTPQTNTNVQYTVSAVASNLLLATFTITNPMKGVWTAAIDAGSITSTQAEYSLMVSGDSNIGLVPQTGPLFNQGEDVVVSCALADLSTNPATPVVNAATTATVQLPDGSTTDVTLLDDGWHNDGAPNDGVYAAVLTNVQQAGTYSITYRATGTDSQGLALQRVAIGGFSVSSGHASLWGDPVYEDLDTDGDGVADFLEVKCWVNPMAAGNYSLAGSLADASGTHRFSKAAAFAADGSGPTMATLIFDLAEMRVAGGDGTYHIENLQLFEDTSAGTAWLDAYQGSSVVTIQAAKAINVSPQNQEANVSQMVDLLWTDGGAASSYDVYFGTNATTLPLQINQTGTTYDPGILAYNTTYYWRIDARNAAGVTKGDTWSFATVHADYYDDYYYTTDNGTITIVGYTGVGGAVTIPSTINDLPVTSIGAGAFYKCTSLTSVTIPSSVMTIGSYAFADCPALGGIYFNGNAPDIDNAYGVFDGDDSATVYYLLTTTGWEDTYGGLPTALWNLPVVVTGAAAGITTSTATLTGTVNPNGAVTVAYFEYGLSISYSSTASVTLAPDNGTTAQAVSAMLAGLQPGTTYHYRLTATNSNGTGCGDATTFTTAPKGNQTITFPALPAKTYGDADFAPDATASSGLAVTYTSSNLTVATIVDGNIHIVSAGTAMITATQAGDANWNAATPVERNFTVAKATATVTLGSLAHTYDGTAKAATATTDPAGLTVGFTYDGAATLPVNAGSYAVVATVNDATYAGTASGTLVIGKATPVITWGAPADITYGTLLDGTQLNATASVPGTFVYTPAAGARLDAGAGQTLRVSFTPADIANYTTAAKEVTLNVGKASQAITFAALAGKTYGDAPFALSATAVSGLAVAFELVSGPATLAGSTLTLTGAGTITVRASQAGDANWNAATPVERNFTVTQKTVTATAENQTRAFGAANPAFTVAYTGFVTGDTAAVLDTPPTAVCSATATSGAGTYPITVSGGSDNNYAFSYVAGTLTIMAALPAVTTATAGAIGTTTATSGGTVTSDGGAAVTARGVCWSTTANPTVANTTVSNGTGTGVFTSTLSGLSAGTTYYVRAYVTNSAGTGYGESRSFATPVHTGADFVVTGIAITPGLPAVGGRFTATVTVLNQGTQKGKGGTLYVWLDKPETAAVGEKGDKSASISTLKPGQSKTVKMSLTAPKTRGTFTLRAVVDAKNVTPEDDEYNNQATYMYDTGLPDFEIQDVSISPETPVAGKTFTAYVTVTNSGEVAGNGGYLDLWADSSILPTPPVPGSKTKGNKYKSVGTLQPGQVKTIKVTGLKVPADNLEPVLGVLIDSRAKTLEADEDNNWFELDYLNNVPGNSNPLSITSKAIDTTATADSLWVKTEPIVWIYNTSGFSTASIMVKGNTNADSVGIETHGDGMILIYKLKLDSTNNFNDTVCIGFSHMSGIYINFDTKIILYGTNGESTEIPLLNPK